MQKRQIKLKAQSTLELLACKRLHACVQHTSQDRVPRPLQMNLTYRCQPQGSVPNWSLRTSSRSHRLVLPLHLPTLRLLAGGQADRVILHHPRTAAAVTVVLPHMPACVHMRRYRSMWAPPALLAECHRRLRCSQAQVWAVKLARLSHITMTHLKALGWVHCCAEEGRAVLPDDAQYEMGKGRQRHKANRVRA